MKNDIRNSELFRELTEGSIEQVLEVGSFRNCSRGDIIFLEGSPGSDFFILVDGRIKLVKSSMEGREITVKIIGPMENFGETVLFESDRYPVTAIAMEKSTLFGIPRTGFQSLLANTDFRNEFIAMLMKKQRYLAGRILYLTSLDVEERFFRFLEDTYGRRVVYRIDLSKKDIASTIGTIPETLSRLLNRLKDRGLVKWEGKKLTLPEGFWEKTD